MLTVSCVSDIVRFLESSNLCCICFLVTQSADDEILVRDVLYDALILVDYSFINDVSRVDQADLLPINLSRLIITLDAVNDAR